MLDDNWGKTDPCTAFIKQSEGMSSVETYTTSNASIWTQSDIQNFLISINRVVFAVDRPYISSVTRYRLSALVISA